MRRLLLIGTPLLVLTLVGVTSRSSPRGGASAQVIRTELVHTVVVSGTLEAVDSVSLGPPPTDDMYQFKIAMMAPEGTEVRAGQPVLAFDASELLVRLEQAGAEADAARARWEQRAVELQQEAADRRLELAEASAALRRADLAAAPPEHLVAGRELALARLDLELARESVASLETRAEAARAGAEAELAGLASTAHEAEESVAELRRAIDRLTVAAPRAGIVIHAVDWRGERKKVGDTCYRAEPVMQVPDLTHMRAVGEVEEAQSGIVRAGQRAVLRLEAHPNQDYTARVAGVSRVVRPKSWRNPRRIVRLELELDRTDSERMRPGMRFTGTIEVERAEDVLAVPLAAVRGGATTFEVVVPLRLGDRSVPVLPGRRFGDLVELLDGPAEGTTVRLLGSEQERP